MTQLIAPYLWRALHRLREPAPLTRLSQLTDPGKFIDQMFLAAGRNLAVASGFLPAAVRNEGKVAFLCCRALDAHEDLNRDADTAAQRIAETADYLLSTSTSLPPLPTNLGNRDPDRLEFLVASRLPWLREAVAVLPAPRRGRVGSLIRDIAQAMTAHARDRCTGAAGADYGEQVLGRVVRYALDLMGIEAAPTVDLASLGRLCQAINDLRDLHDDASTAQESANCDREVKQSSLWLELAETAAVAVSALRELRFVGVAGARAALIYMSATTLKAAARQANFPLPWLTKRPVWAALTASASRRAYRRLLLQIDRIVLGVMIHRARVGAGDPTPPPAPNTLLCGSRQDAFEAALADRHPDPAAAIDLKRSCRLFRYALLLTRSLPPIPLSSRPENNPDGPLLMLSDYLMASAITGLRGAGLPVLAGFGRACAALSDELQDRPGQTDREGHLAAFLTEVVGTASGLTRTEIEKRCHENRKESRRLHRADVQRSVIHKFKMYLFG